MINWVLEWLGAWSRLAPIQPTLMTTVEQRINLFHLASQVLAYNVPGALVEVGCNEGKSSVLLQKIIERYDPSRELHVYDSFEGLPARTGSGGGNPAFEPGVMRTTEERLLANFRRYELRPPVVHKGWFEDTLPCGLPDRIAFAHLDGDLYESILVSLEHVYPRLSKGAICVIDDYAHDPDAFPDWPGVKQACDEYLADKPERVEQLYGGSSPHGYFRKR